VLALNAKLCSWSRPISQHPRAPGGVGDHRRWRCCRRTCRQRGGEQWTTVRTTHARTLQCVSPAAVAPSAAVVAVAAAAAAAAGAWHPCYFLAPPRRPSPRAITGFPPHPSISVAPHSSPCQLTATPPRTCASRSSASSLHCGKQRPLRQRRSVVARMVAAVPWWQPPPATVLAATADHPVVATGAPRGDLIPPLGRIHSAGLLGVFWWPLTASG